MLSARTKARKIYFPYRMHCIFIHVNSFVCIQNNIEHKLPGEIFLAGNWNKKRNGVWPGDVYSKINNQLIVVWTHIFPQIEMDSVTILCVRLVHRCSKTVCCSVELQHMRTPTISPLNWFCIDTMPPWHCHAVCKHIATIRLSIWTLVFRPYTNCNIQNKERKKKLKQQLSSLHKYWSSYFRIAALIFGLNFGFYV